MPDDLYLDVDPSVVFDLGQSLISDEITALVELIKNGYRVIPSQGNFVFATPPDRNGRRVYEGLYARKILVRLLSDPYLSHGLRISIGTREEMEVTLAALKEIG